MQEIEQIIKALNIKVNRFTKDQVINHCRDTALFVKYFADLIEFKNGDPVKAVLAAKLHDIGKLRWKNRLFVLPYHMLQDKDWKHIYAHPADGVDMLKSIDNCQQCLSGNPSVIDIIYAHHEKPDGTGYYRLTDLSIEMVILHISDVFNACAAKRPYKGSMPENIAAKMAVKPFVGYLGESLASGTEERLKEIYRAKHQYPNQNLCFGKNKDIKDYATKLLKTMQNM